MHADIHTTHIAFNSINQPCYNLVGLGLEGLDAADMKLRRDSESICGNWS